MPDTPSPFPTPGSAGHHANTPRQREELVELALQRLPETGRRAVRWLRQPGARWARIPLGLVLIAGSALAMLPVFGMWMLPFGLLLLAEDVPPLRRLSERLLRWVERKRPHWLGLAPPHRD